MRALQFSPSLQISTRRSFLVNSQNLTQTTKILITTNESKSLSSSSSKPVETLGYIGMMQLVFKDGPKEGSYLKISQINYHDKQTGSYKRATNVEKASYGLFEWKNGTSETRNEFKRSQTVRFGDRTGYTEVYSEQRVRNVKYNNHSSGYGYGYRNDPESDSDSDSESGIYGCGYGLMVIVMVTVMVTMILILTNN